MIRFSTAIQYLFWSFFLTPSSKAMPGLESHQRIKWTKKNIKIYEPLKSGQTHTLDLRGSYFVIVSSSIFPFVIFFSYWFRGFNPPSPTLVVRPLKKKKKKLCVFPTFYFIQFFCAFKINQFKLYYKKKYALGFTSNKPNPLYLLIYSILTIRAYKDR